MLTLAEEDVIRAAAVADRAYWDLLHSADDNHPRRQAMMERKLAIERELQRPPPDPAPLSASLEDAVDVELERRRPYVTRELALYRERRRMASNCGPAQLRLGHSASARQQLVGVVRNSQLSVREVALAIGYTEKTLERHLAGEQMCRERRAWYHRLVAIEMLEGNLVHVVSRLVPTMKRWGWNLTPQEKRKLIVGR